jgi:hypothetical protein
MIGVAVWAAAGIGEIGLPTAATTRRLSAEQRDSLGAIP